MTVESYPEPTERSTSIPIASQQIDEANLPIKESNSSQLNSYDEPPQKIPKVNNSSLTRD